MKVAQYLIRLPGINDTDGATVTGCNLLLLRKLQKLHKLDFIFNSTTQPINRFYALVAFQPSHFPFFSPSEEVLPLYIWQILMFRSINHLGVSDIHVD